MNAQDGNPRKFALLVLYAVDGTAGSVHVEDAMSRFRASFSGDLEGLDSQWGEILARVSGVTENLGEIDDEIRVLCPRWKVERMALVDRNILRLGIWEILKNRQPAIRVINELVDLAKDYGEKSTPGFVNGLLDQMCRNHEIKLGRSKS
jgi:transcription antitermination protein NusB